MLVGAENVIRTVDLDFRVRDSINEGTAPCTPIRAPLRHCAWFHEPARDALDLSPSISGDVAVSKAA